MKPDHLFNPDEARLRREYERDVRDTIIGGVVSGVTVVLTLILLLSL